MSHLSIIPRKYLYIDTSPTDNRHIYVIGNGILTVKGPVVDRLGSLYGLLFATLPFGSIHLSRTRPGI